MTDTTQITSSAAQEVAAKTQESMDAFFSKLTEAATVVTEKLVEVAPDAAEAMLNLVQFKGVFGLVLGLVFAIGLFVSIRMLSKVRFDEYNDPDSPKSAVNLVGGIAGSVVSTAGVLINLFPFYNWLAAFYPEGAIALKALEAVGINI